MLETYSLYVIPVPGKDRKMSDVHETKTVALPQGTVSYRDLGDGEPIIFVHGLLVDGRLWTGVAERLASDFRCLVVDWPMGSHRIAMNPDADLSPPGMAEVVVALRGLSPTGLALLPSSPSSPPVVKRN